MTEIDVVEDRSAAIVFRIHQALFLVLTSCIVLTSCNLRDTPVFRSLAEASDKERTQQTEEAIRNDPELQKLNEICESIPRPRDSSLVGKSRGESNGKALWLYFQTEVSFEDLEKVWSSYFSENGWQVADREYAIVGRTLTVQKEGYSIDVQYGGLGSGANLAYTCKQS
ncbi:MAG: hypothetical protein KF831_12450 [Acidobacteria bacterium]|nr:hypothetical protein [Acidobacteriota bacterium]